MENPVWLIDDMECALEIVKLFLEKHGFSTVIYSSPLKALHDLEQGQKPQLVITDYSMPEMSGTDFLDVVRSFFPDVPAIIITGDPTPIPLKYKDIPIIEKGHIDFIKNLVNQILKIKMQSESKLIKEHNCSSNSIKPVKSKAKRTKTHKTEAFSLRSDRSGKM